MNKMFDDNYNAFDHIQHLDETMAKVTKNMEQIAGLLNEQSRYLEILTINYRQQASELGQQRLYIQLLDQRINQLENLK